MRFVLLHYHLFKNAGSTIEDILDHSFGERLDGLETPVDGGIVTNAELVRYLDERPELQAFSSHQIRYPLPEAPGYLFFDICFLRDPLDRLRSFYDYFRARPNPENPISTLANKCEPGDFVAGMIRDHSLFVRNNQVNLIGCAGDSDDPNETDLALAIRRMRQSSFLGVVDCFDQSIAVGAQRLHPAFPELDCARPAVNVSKGMSGTVTSRTAELQEACDPEVFAQLLRMTALDLRLVEAAREEIQRREDAITPEQPVTERLPGFVDRVLRGRRLRAIFDSDFYLKQNPDVRDAGIDPLRHYLRHGAAEDRAPHPLFQPRYYRMRCAGKLPPGVNLFAHFLDAGASAVSPHPLFDCDAYRTAYPEVIAQNVNPLGHYLRRAQPVIGGIDRHSGSADQRARPRRRGASAASVSSNGRRRSDPRQFAVKIVLPLCDPVPVISLFHALACRGGDAAAVSGRVGRVEQAVNRFRHFGSGLREDKIHAGLQIEPVHSRRRADDGPPACHRFQDLQIGAGRRDERRDHDRCPRVSGTDICHKAFHFDSRLVEIDANLAAMEIQKVFVPGSGDDVKRSVT